jgi:acyl-CoA oxidase
LLQLVAKGLLTEYGDEFGNLDTAGMVRYLASTAVETVIEKTNDRVLWNRLRSVVPGLDGEPAEGVLDSDYHLAMLAGVARRLKAGIDGGGDAAVVFSACQPHLIGAARAHAERLVLSAFLGRLAELDESPEHDALQLMCRLYALSCIEADRGWFLEHGRLGAARSKAITPQVDALCRDVRPLAGELVEAFGIPPEVRRTEMRA